MFEPPRECPEELKARFRERQARAMEQAVSRGRRQLRAGILAGGAAGIAAVLVTSAVTRRTMVWHSCLLEAVFGVVAGWLLVRFDGGIMKGMLLFSAAYLAAFLSRAIGLDPSILMGLDLESMAAVQGHQVSLLFLCATGGVMGQVMED